MNPELIVIDELLQKLEEHKAKLEARRKELMLAEVEKSGIIRGND